MDSSRQGHRLLQAGIALFLFAAVVGLTVPYFKLPRLALSAHLVAILQGIFMLVLGHLWPKFELSQTQRCITFWLLIYQSIVAPLSNLLGGIWAAGGSIVPIASAGVRGNNAQEFIVNAGLRSAGAALIIGLLFLAWGLRRSDAKT